MLLRGILLVFLSIAVFTFDSIWIQLMKDAVRGFVYIDFISSRMNSIGSYPINTAINIQADVIGTVENYVNELLPIQTFQYGYIKSNMQFLLYTRQNLLNPDLLSPNQPHSIKLSHYRPEIKTVLLVHGITTNAFSAGSVQLIKTELLKNEDINVIGVNYGSLTEGYNCLLCGLAINSIQGPMIGKYIGEMIDQLIDLGQSPDSVHVIGHSLGAHLAAFAGKYMNKIGKPIYRITGLDPSSFGLDRVSTAHRLTENDAKFTDCIITTPKSFAVRNNPCQANFYPNQCDARKLGCDDDFLFAGLCSHSRVVDLFAESINTKPVDFPTKLCDKTPCSDRDVTCWHQTNQTVMGYWAKPGNKWILSSTSFRPQLVVDVIYGSPAFGSSNSDTNQHWIEPVITLWDGLGFSEKRLGLESCVVFLLRRTNLLACNSAWTGIFLCYAVILASDSMINSSWVKGIFYTETNSEPPYLKRAR